MSWLDAGPMDSPPYKAERGTLFKYIKTSVPRRKAVSRTSDVPAVRAAESPLGGGLAHALPYGSPPSGPHMQLS